MGINFVSNKCACGGKLEYNAQKKVWICKYCGTTIEREATFEGVHVDGIEGINDVVRQTLSDVAAGKLDSAKRNLDDCERKNHRHVGTLIANMSYYLAMISCAKSKEEAMEYLDNVKKYMGRFKSEFAEIGPDEINLYESFGNSTADIYANLIAIYDTLGDEGRVEFILSKLDASDIFSKSVNRNLLKVAIKRSYYDVVDKIVANINHIDRKYSLGEILDKYPDGDKKLGIVDRLFDAEVAEQLTKEYFEHYFKECGDSLDTKIHVMGLLSETTVRCSMAEIVRAIWPQLVDYNAALALFKAVYSIVVKDRDTEAILVMCLEDPDRCDILAAFFDALIAGKTYIRIDAKTVMRFLESTKLDVDNTLGILQRMFSFNLDDKTIDAIYNYYLNENKDETSRRMQIIGKIFWKDCKVSVNTVKRYVVQTSADGDYKPAVVQRLFDIGVNKTYLGDILSEYMMKTQDADAVKKQIFDYLVASGFKADAAVLLDYIKQSTDSAAIKTSNIKKLISNGTQLRPECLDAYITSLRQPQDFNIELFNLLLPVSNGLSGNAFTRYLLECRDADKGRHVESLLRASGNGYEKTNITYDGIGISCNQLQAYVLLTKDDYDNAAYVVRSFVNSGIRINDEIVRNNVSVKFKKFASEIRQTMSPVTLQLCEQNKVFSLF